LTDDQKGYNLRSKNVVPKPLLASPVKNKEVVAPVKNKEVVAPVKNKEVATKQPAAHVKQTSSPAKQWQKQTQPLAKEQVTLKAPSNEIKASDK
jgi:hypothetical protein